jgi:stringent starvation protein B
MSEVEKPNKKEICEALLEGPWVFVHLDPRREGVMVPNWFKNQAQLVLQLGLNMAIPIPDLEIGEEAITCTLSFSRQRHFCRLPWSAIYALLGDDGRGMVWPEDVPPEVAAQSRAQKQPARVEAVKPKVAAVPKPKLEEAPALASPAADETASKDEAPAAKTGGKKAEGKAKKGKAAAKNKEPLAAAPAEIEPRAAEAASDGDGEEIAAAPPKKAKRELPPYLRVIK